METSMPEIQSPESHEGAMFLTMLAAWPATVLYMGLLVKLGVESTAWVCGGALYLAFVVNPSVILGILSRSWGLTLVFLVYIPVGGALLTLMIVLIALGPSGVEQAWHILW